MKNQHYNNLQFVVCKYKLATRQLVLDTISTLIIINKQWTGLLEWWNSEMVEWLVTCYIFPVVSHVLVNLIMCS